MILTGFITWDRRSISHNWEITGTSMQLCYKPHQCKITPLISKQNSREPSTCEVYSVLGFVVVVVCCVYFSVGMHLAWNKMYLCKNLNLVHSTQFKENGFVVLLSIVRNYVFSLLWDLCVLQGGGWQCHRGDRQAKTWMLKPCLCGEMLCLWYVLHHLLWDELLLL